MISTSEVQRGTVGLDLLTCHLLRVINHRTVIGYSCRNGIGALHAGALPVVAVIGRSSYTPKHSVCWSTLVRPRARSTTEANDRGQQLAHRSLPRGVSIVEPTTARNKVVGRTRDIAVRKRQKSGGMSLEPFLFVDATRRIKFDSLVLDRYVSYAHRMLLLLLRLYGASLN